MGGYKVLPLVGLKSLRAFNAYHTLLLGYKMLPMYLNVSYEDFLKKYDTYSDNEKEKILREAVTFVPIEQEELDALTCFCADINGVPLTHINTAEMKPAQLMDIVVTVCLELSKISVFMVSENVKKNSKTSA